PLVSVSSTCKDNATELRLTQDRFVGVPGGKPDRPQTWTFPVCLKTGAGTPACHVVSKREETIRVAGCGAPVFVNADSAGYFFTDYAPDVVRAFAKDGGRALSTAERLRLLGDEWSMVRAGRHDVGTYLDVASAFANDTSPAVVDE